MRASVRAVLALAMLAGAYLLTLCIVLFWLSALTNSLWSYRSFRWSVVYAVGTVVTFPLLVLLVREMVRISRADGPHPGSVPIIRAEAPRLWKTVRTLADRVGTAAPGEIRLTAEVNAAVTDDSWLLGLGPHRRRLYLGVPLLAGLRPDELRAVLAHELGHYARRHVRFSEPANRGCIALTEAHRRMRDAMPANKLVRLYLTPLVWSVGAQARIFVRLTLPIRQKQELEADRIAARVAGADALASALQRVPALAAAWTTFQESIAAPYRETTGRVPDHPFKAFTLMLQDPATEPLLNRARKWELLTSSIDERKSHPPLADRLARLTTTGVGASSPEWESDLEPGLDDVDDTVLRYLAQRGIVEDVGADRQPWEDWVAGLAAHHAAASTVGLARALRAVAAHRPVRLDTALDLIEDRRGRDLARALCPLAPRGEKGDHSSRRQLADAIEVVIGCALVTTGSARWKMGWMAPSSLIPAPTAGELGARVAAAVEDPLEVPRLRWHLTQLGIEPDAVDIDDPPHAGPNPPLIGGTGRPEGKRRRDRRPAYAAAAVLLLIGANSLLRLSPHYPDPSSLRLAIGLWEVQDESTEPLPSPDDYQAVQELIAFANSLAWTLFDDRATYGPESGQVAVTLLRLGLVERDLGRLSLARIKRPFGAEDGPPEGFIRLARARFIEAIAILEVADPSNEELTRLARTLLEELPQIPP